MPRSDKIQQPKPDTALVKNTLNAQVLRLQSIACLKQTTSIWRLDERGICEFFENYVSLPGSPLTAKDLIGEEGVRIVKNESKVFMGEVSHRKKQGRGIALYKDGRIFEGGFSQNEKNGYGCQLYSNGNLYIGEFSQNKKHGMGSFYWFSLCTPACTKDSGYSVEQYHGNWWGGLPDGQGEHLKVNGDFYSGQFKNGLKHGSGSERYANGDEYVGEFINGLPEGFGQYRWTDGSIYKGDFKQGYRNGYGVWESTKKKQTFKGHYLLDRKHGYGVHQLGKGRVYKGNYFQDMRTGEGDLFEGQELVYSGLWEDGRQLQSFTPQKSTPQRKNTSVHHLKTQEKNMSQSARFRVKTSKPKTHERNCSASATHKRSYQINFIHCDKDETSTHRGCVACKVRPKRGEYNWANPNPEEA